MQNKSELLVQEVNKKVYTIHFWKIQFIRVHYPYKGKILQLRNWRIVQNYMYVTVCCSEHHKTLLYLVFVLNELYWNNMAIYSCLLILLVVEMP